MQYILKTLIGDEVAQKSVQLCRINIETQTAEPALRAGACPKDRPVLEYTESPSGPVVRNG